jgi:hypothetical protein
MWVGVVPRRDGLGRGGRNTIASALSASVRRPWWASQAVTSSSPWAAVRRADRVVTPDANMAPSSTYSWTVLSVHVELRWRIMAEVYVAERMGDNGDPCGVPDSTGKGEEEALLKARRVLRGAKLTPHPLHPGIQDTPPAAAHTGRCHYWRPPFIKGSTSGGFPRHLRDAEVSHTGRGLGDKLRNQLKPRGPFRDRATDRG